MRVENIGEINVEISIFHRVHEYIHKDYETSFSYYIHIYSLRPSRICGNIRMRDERKCAAAPTPLWILDPQEFIRLRVRFTILVPLKGRTPPHWIELKHLFAVSSAPATKGLYHECLIVCRFVKSI